METFQMSKKNEKVIEISAERKEAIKNAEKYADDMVERFGVHSFRAKDAKKYIEDLKANS